MMTRNRQIGKNDGIVLGAAKRHKVSDELVLDPLAFGAVDGEAPERGLVGGNQTAPRGKVADVSRSGPMIETWPPPGQAAPRGVTMIVGVDHLVIVVRELEAAIEAYRALGFSVQPGGVHGDGASHNALIGFADGSYLELFAFLDTTAPRHPAWLATLDRGGGISDLCLRTDDLAAEVRRLQAAGLPYPDPVPMSRRRPDGRVIAWRLSVPARTARRWLPFLIEDDTAREWRVPTGDAATHPNGATGIARVDVQVSGPSAIVGELARALGATPQWRAAHHHAQFTVGSSILDCAVFHGGNVAGPVRVWFTGRDDADRQERIVENARLVLEAPSSERR